MGKTSKQWATFEVEHALHSEGYSLVAGIDEVGRGPLAGPVTIGLVILPADWDVPVTDSKLLSAKVRSELAAIIHEKALVCEVIHVEPSFIDDHGIVCALREAGDRAWQALNKYPDIILLDGSHNYLDCPVPVRTIVRGDSKSASIAAASIVAKVARDELMKDLALEFPDYGFDTHVGYGTLKHRDAISRYGPTRLHRMSFLRNIL